MKTAIIVIQHKFLSGKTGFVAICESTDVLNTLKENLQCHPKIRGVYMANHSVSGCAEAIREAGRRGTVHVISHDLTDATRRLLQRGEIDFVIAQNIYRQGYRPLIILNEYIRTRFMLEEESPSIDIICAENVLGRVLP